MQNWRTTLFGALAAVVYAVKPMLPAEWQQLADAVAGVFAGIGLVLAKDAKTKQ
jgi:hypothetical protein